MNKLYVTLFILFSTFLHAEEYTTERSIFLNGIDISSARNQKLGKVDIHIDENGNIFITAAHYDVLEEGSYVPLSKWSKQINTASMHKSPTELQKNMLPPPPATGTTEEKTVEMSSPEAENVPVEKPGNEWPDANSE